MRDPEFIEKQNKKNEGIKNVVEKVNSNQGVFSEDFGDEDYTTVGIPENLYSLKHGEVSTDQLGSELGPIDKKSNSIGVTENFSLEDGTSFEKGDRLYTSKAALDTHKKKMAFGTRGVVE